MRQGTNRRNHWLRGEGQLHSWRWEGINLWMELCIPRGWDGEWGVLSLCGVKAASVLLRVAGQHLPQQE